MTILKSTIDAIYLYRSGYLETLDKRRQHLIIASSLLSRINILIIRLLKELKIFIFHSNPEINFDNKVVCIINSKNNFEALKFIENDNVMYVKLTVTGKDLKNVITYRFKNKIFFTLRFFFFLPILLFNKLNRRDLLVIQKAYGLQILFLNLLKNQNPRLIVFANDHIPEMRSYIIACQKKSIRTAFIQHGSVSKYFPPLEFNLALLDSKYSEGVYSKSKKIETQIQLIGIPKLDTEILKIRDRTEVNNIGLAINQNDELEIVNNIIKVLKKNNFKVLLRKHPADTRHINHSPGIFNGNDMSVFEFIHKSDFIIASDSSIHVESNSLKCRSVYFQMHKNINKRDYYGFVKNNYLLEVSSFDNLINTLKQFDYKKFDFNSKEIRYYNEGLSNKLYGKSSEIANKIINNFN